MRDNSPTPEKLDLFGTYFDTLKAAKWQRGGTSSPETPMAVVLEAVRSQGGRAKYSDLWQAACRVGVPEDVFVSAVSRLASQGMLAHERPQGGTDKDVEFILTDQGRGVFDRRGFA
jgi:DNA-binding transcriptional regulator PaaX